MDIYSILLGRMYEKSFVFSAGQQSTWLNFTDKSMWYISVGFGMAIATKLVVQMNMLKVFEIFKQGKKNDLFPLQRLSEEKSAQAKVHKRVQNDRSRSANGFVFRKI